MSFEVAGSFQRLPESLPQVFGLVDTFLAQGGLGPSNRFLCDFALEELFTNTVKYNPEGGGEIAIRLRLEDEEIQITLTDFHAPPFDPLTQAPEVDPTLPLEQRTPGGLGIFLLKGLMDRIEYQYEEPVATIRLFKKLE